MTYSSDRLDRIEAIALQNALSIQSLSEEMRQLTSNVDRVLARSAVLDDVLLELRDSHERHEARFEEHQRIAEENLRTTNAALERLDAILMQLIRNSEQK